MSSIKMKKSMIAKLDLTPFRPFRKLNKIVVDIVFLDDLYGSPMDIFSVHNFAVPNFKERNASIASEVR